MFTKFLVAAAALTAAAVATVPAQAKTNIDVNVGLGFGGGYGGYYGGGYYGGGYYPVYNDYNDGISCWKARKIVQNHGFYKVNTMNCGGPVMRFKGKKAGDWYRVKVNRWGKIIDVDPI